MAPVNSVANTIMNSDVYAECNSRWADVDQYKNWDGYGDSDAYLANLRKRIGNGDSIKGATSWAYKHC